MDNRGSRSFLLSRYDPTKTFTSGMHAPPNRSFAYPKGARRLSSGEVLDLTHHIDDANLFWQRVNAFGQAGQVLAPLGLFPRRDDQGLLRDGERRVRFAASLLAPNVMTDDIRGDSDQPGADG
jgi:hypothetical protein